MCGIIGYNGIRQATNILIDSLKRLEYRGYDSAGIAVLNNKAIEVYKDKGRIIELERDLPEIISTVGIGHTRWATHGKPNKANAHPHTSGDIAVVHNGIIENYEHLRDRLTQLGYVFVSETDTEALAHLINHYYRNNLMDAVVSALNDIKGSYAIAVLCGSELVAARKDSPLIIGIGDNENFIASDIPAILKYTRNIIYLDDMEVACVTPDCVSIFDINKRQIEKTVNTIDWDLEAAEKSGYDHFMLKEIHEQPRALHETFAGRISELEGNITFDGLNLTEEEIRSISRISIIACGTSFNAGLLGKYLFEYMTHIHVDVEIASEFRYAHSSPGSLVIAISQSGETADTLAALREAKSFGCRTLAITNVVGSTITREVDSVIYTRSGPEIGVAATKTFLSQVGVLYLLSLYFGKLKGIISSDRIKLMLVSLKKLSAQIRRILDDKESIRYCAEAFAPANDVFFIGRTFNYPIALEGALKLKEISYIHAEGYAAGELKHGPLALIANNTPVVAIATRGPIYDKMVNNIKEVKAREAPVIAIADEKDSEIEKYVDTVIRVPSTEYVLSPVLSTVVVQLFSYYVAKSRKCPIDQPRNLAKSVTVE
ncbi:glucosamine--fructose-6-phosphate aminotransferase, isomerizing [Candidatus Methanoperedens nitroreducens]|uniref:Glutamine--fructose-6-phosphate aminotransferase [isomerizing] n=1 Tax=Candidatus Methanoperedens nitratireducens TaxID=1392998 RepID=A0A062VD45_9EURY|nr:glutamine--fructose-6-phosphate transaminase (isomerizing) [Candidatus Methanoperedens nitroreducens]KCZ73180.1 glucosamine--fructose-6-phosphate aminotransferase, isomerizing [Candidatus Methanoperedens nitroreducens]MDJ1422871.1 glutamine--fructose-6-phosphate transaminase (isomerizing) [Candidatus Methanoperedens sp.]